MGKAFTQIGVYPHVRNPGMRTRDSSFIVTVPFGNDLALRRQIFACKPPLSVFVFGTTYKENVYKLDFFSYLTVHLMDIGSPNKAPF
jgi:hypothetical protein